MFAAPTRPGYPSGCPGLYNAPIAGRASLANTSGAAFALRIQRPAYDMFSLSLQVVGKM